MKLCFKGADILGANGCLASIRLLYKNLTPTEKKLADFISENASAVCKMSTGELCAAAGVVKSLVVRFSKSIGFSGYSELKDSLIQELARNEELNFSPYIERSDSSTDILNKIFSANIKTLRDTAERVDKEVLRDVVELLEGAGNIYIYGIGTSAGIADDFQYRLMQLGYTAFCFTDVVSMKVSALNIKKGDAAIGISNSGRTAATVDALRMAKEKGASTVCVTSYPKSDIVNTSDFPIVIATDEIQYPIEAISGRIAHISILDTIAVSLSAKHYDSAMERSVKTHEIINTVRY